MLRTGRTALVQDIVREQLCQPLRTHRSGYGLTYRYGKAEIKHRRQPIDARVPRESRRIELGGSYFAEDMKIRDAFGECACLHGRNELLPKFRIDVLRRVDAKAVEGELVDPVAEDLDESLQYSRVFCHQIIEAAEIAHRGAFAAKRGVPSIVVVNGIVEPLGNLDVFFARWHIRRVGIVGARQLREVLGGLVRRCVAEKPRIDCLSRDPAAPRVRVVRA